MNFYKRYNELESEYNNNPDTKECFKEMSIAFADYLQQLVNQIERNKDNSHSSENCTCSIHSGCHDHKCCNTCNPVNPEKDMERKQN